MNNNDAEEQPTDLIIIGAGAAGLSLLLALKERNYPHTVKVLEQQNGPQHDRIWSFWNSEDLPFYIKAIISHEWSSFTLIAPYGPSTSARWPSNMLSKKQI